MADHGDVSDLSELDYLAQTQISNNLMTQAARQVAGGNAAAEEPGDPNAKSRIFARVSAPSIEAADFMAKSNISVPSDIGAGMDRGDLSKRTPTQVFRRMDDAESIGMTPDGDDQSATDSAGWMKSIITSKKMADPATEADDAKAQSIVDGQLAVNNLGQAVSNNPLS